MQCLWLRHLHGFLVGIDLMSYIRMEIQGHSLILQAIELVQPRYQCVFSRCSVLLSCS